MENGLEGEQMDNIEMLSSRSLPVWCDRILLGDFDGLHLGHRALFGAITADSIVFTFSRNTKRSMGHIGATIYPTHINRTLIGSLGARRIYYADFEELRDYSPMRFCEYIAVGFHPRTVVCGENFTFGKNASGDSVMLRELLSGFGIDCDIVSEVKQCGTTVSSSIVRKAIADGDMERAESLLGEPYFITGEVQRGKTLGRKIGTPTVNLPIYDRCVVPKYGVYISSLELDGKSYIGVTNIGVRPTVENGAKVNSETFLLDFDGDTYGKTVIVRLRKYLREERKFDNTDSLSRQIKEDARQALSFF